MSAIFGIWQINGENVKETDLLQMQAGLTHYGRNQQDLRLRQDLGLGACLYQPDLSRMQDTPVYMDETGNILVSDAQIYNQTELINEYKLVGSENVSTQALLMAAYRKWGEKCPRYLNGDFAFAVWDRQKKQLFIARDHLGVRPLFYYYSGSTFAFATDMRVLLALPWVGKQLDEVKLYSLLSNTYHIAPERTYFEHIRSLPQAHALKVNSQSIQKEKYWTPGAGEKITFSTDAEYTQALFDVVDDAIRRRVNYTQAVIGAELSGGLDSAVITILASRELKRNGRSLGNLYSWSPPVDLLDLQPADERELIAAVCRQEGLHCLFDNRLEVSAVRGDHATLPSSGSASEKPLYRELQELSSRGVSYILSGWGGDDAISQRTSLFSLLRGGYWKHFVQQTWLLAQGSFLKFLKVVLANSIIIYLKRRFRYFYQPDKRVPSIASKEFTKKMKRHCKKDRLEFAVNPVNYLESGAIQTRTELTARLGAVFNVQQLFPFLDYQVVDFALSIPRTLYHRQGVNRYIFRQAFSEILPRDYAKYSTKDDIAKSTLYRSNLAEENLTKIRAAVSQLDRNLFSTYINWDSLQAMVNASSVNQKANVHIPTKLAVCMDIQTILAETVQESVSMPGSF